MIKHFFQATSLLASIMYFTVSSTSAQVTTRFNAELSGQRLRDLFSAAIQNTSAMHISVRLTIAVSRIDNNEMIVQIVTPSFQLLPGINSIQSFANNSRLQFANSTTAVTVSQTGVFPPGDYEYCFELFAADDKQGSAEKTFQDCFTGRAAPIFPLTLVYPPDEDEVCSPRPVFMWRPLMPLHEDTRYRILVAEVKTDQQPADAIMMNLPVMQLDNVTINHASYPTLMPDLHKNARYAWQVTATGSGAGSVASEIWTFTIKCQDTIVDSVAESYRQLAPTVNGNYYLAADKLQCSLLNPYGPANADFTITPMAGAGKSIRNLPIVKMYTGINKVEIPLEDVKGLEAGTMYLLKVNNAGDHPVYMRFLYKGQAFR